MEKPINRVLIYRLEDKSGVGPYTDCKITFLEAHNRDQNKHPTPNNDKGILRQPNNNEITGFKDKEQLYHWFSESEINFLARKGFTLKKLWVREITAVGERQVLAIR